MIKWLNQLFGARYRYWILYDRLGQKHFIVCSIDDPIRRWDYLYNLYSGPYLTLEKAQEIFKGLHE